MDCPICGSDDIEIINSKQKTTKKKLTEEYLLKCCDCGHVYRNTISLKKPRPYRLIISEQDKSHKGYNDRQKQRQHHQHAVFAFVQYLFCHKNYLRFIYLVCIYMISKRYHIVKRGGTKKRPLFEAAQDGSFRNNFIFHEPEGHFAFGTNPVAVIQPD